MDTTTAPDTSAADEPRGGAAARIPLPVRMLRRLRPLVAGLLGSPLHRLLSRDVLLLSYRGRRSGRRYTLPLSYVRHGEHLYLCTRPGESRWWRNLARPDGMVDVELRLRGVATRARASVLDSTSAEALAGLRAFVTRNPATGRMLYHVAHDRGRPREADLAREVGGSVVVRLTLAG